MSRHPVTPMAEADLRRHLAAQGLEDVGLVDYRAYADGSATPAHACPDGKPAVLFDVATEADLAAIGGLLLTALGNGPMLAVGASSVARAFAAAYAGSSTTAPAACAKHRSSGPALALVGSLSPVTRAQVEAARGYAMLPVDAGRLLSDESYAAELRAAALSKLAKRDVMLVTEQPAGAPTAAGAVAKATGALLSAIIAEADLGRLIVAGGDTSTMAIRSLPIWGLSYRGPCVPGAPLCRCPFPRFAARWSRDRAEGWADGSAGLLQRRGTRGSRLKRADFPRNCAVIPGLRVSEEPGNQNRCSFHKKAQSGQRLNS